MDFMDKKIQPLLREAGKTSIDAKVRLVSLFYYAPNFEEVERAYCFQVVRDSVYPFITLFDACHLMNRPC